MYHKICTKPILKDIIPFFWIGELHNTPGDYFVHRDIARSASQLILHYEGSFNESDDKGNIRRSPVFGIYGQTTMNRRYICASERSGILGIKLSPVAIPLLFSIPAQELTNQTFELADVMGREGASLTDAVYSAATNQRRIAILSSFFENKLREVPDKYIRVLDAVLYIDRMKGAVAIKDLVGRSCLSQRQFQRSFRELTGFPVQVYLKLLRFENALRNYPLSKSGGMTGLALASGYFDQAHFNHDFKLFTGLSPSAYFESELSIQK